MKTAYNQNHPVALAVEPLRADAMDKAEKAARVRVADVIAELKENDMDAQVTAPYPMSGFGRADYAEKKGHYSFVRMLTSRDPERTVVCPRMNDPEYRIENQEAVEHFVNRCREMASESYDAYICKLIGKIGDADKAELSGNFIWNESVLTVTKGEEVSRWKTQMIVNVSKLGKLFNQFPTRKMK
ncbi:hypothetical protein POP12_157 [Pectobacterium phage POP12]|nr:hypothetical protein POP12_157 [Pectobacterium phage POP12]